MSYTVPPADVPVAGFRHSVERRDGPAWGGGRRFAATAVQTYAVAPNEQAAVGGGCAVAEASGAEPGHVGDPPL